MSNFSKDFSECSELFWWVNICQKYLVLFSSLCGLTHHWTRFQHLKQYCLSPILQDFMRFLNRFWLIMSFVLRTEKWWEHPHHLRVAQLYSTQHFYYFAFRGFNMKYQSKVEAFRWWIIFFCGRRLKKVKYFVWYLRWCCRWWKVPEP